MNERTDWGRPEPRIWEVADTGSLEDATTTASDVPPRGRGTASVLEVARLEVSAHFDTSVFHSDPRPRGRAVVLEDGEPAGDFKSEVGSQSSAAHVVLPSSAVGLFLRHPLPVVVSANAGIQSADLEDGGALEDGAIPTSKR